MSNSRVSSKYMEIFLWIKARIFLEILRNKIEKRSVHVKYIVPRVEQVERVSGVGAPGK